jgi:hypothetical protein
VRYIRTLSGLRRGVHRRIKCGKKRSVKRTHLDDAVQQSVRRTTATNARPVGGTFCAVRRLRCRTSYDAVRTSYDAVPVTMPRRKTSTHKQHFALTPHFNILFSRIISQPLACPQVGCAFEISAKRIWRGWVCDTGLMCC